MPDDEGARPGPDPRDELLGLATELLRLDDYDRMLDAIVNGALRMLRGDRGFLVLTRGDGYDVRVVRNWSRDELYGEDEVVSRTIVAQAQAQRSALLIEDAAADGRFAHLPSVMELRIRSVLAAPLLVDDEPVAVLYLESRDPERLFGAGERELFVRILHICSRALSLATRRLLLERRNEELEQRLRSRFDLQGLVTRDGAFVRVIESLLQAAASHLPVLLEGPSGSGKELLARAVHANSPRARRPLVTVNCAALSPSLLESELFGHVRGAFTGATADKEGLIPSADGGTLFLDEVGELPRELQVKLLRTIQFGEVQPVGSTRTRTVDVRYVAATNRRLQQEVREGRFREDLYFRLNAFTVAVPPLRERPDDVLPLFHHFLREAAARLGRPLPEVTPKLERALQAYGWPGNVRELENEAHALLAMTPAGMPLTADRLGQRILSAGPVAAPPSLEEQERELVELHLRLAGGNRTRAAQSLGLSREGLRKKLKRLGID